MNSVAMTRREPGTIEVPRDRAGLIRYLARLCGDVAADCYMLLDLGCEDGDAAILSCNWIFDTVRGTGPALLRRIAEAPCTTFLGQEPRPWRPAREGRRGGLLTTAEANFLESAGHVEIASTRLRAGRACFAAMFSAAVPGSLQAERVGAAMVSLSYALSALSSGATASSAPASVSERERECLLWASEGKTTEEIATIVGVAANTVNSYVNSAARKLAARNRAMAIANAIRSGVI